MTAFLQSQRLPHPVRITEQVWPEGTVPVVSVFCITYNHVNFIRDAIEGFLMQETDFPVEIFIHDDASTDGTAQIVKEYADKYPKLFWTILQTENQYLKERFNFFFDYLFKQRGKLIALCEGDDYWTDFTKLQRQVDVLVNNKNCSLCFHPVKIQRQNRDLPEIYPDSYFCREKIFGHELVKKNFIPTCSTVFKKAAFDFIKFDHKLAGLKMGDWPLFAMVAQKGYMHCIINVMGVYRIHDGGVWSSANESYTNLAVAELADRMSRTLRFSDALVWWRLRTASEVLTEFYRFSFDGDVMNYLKTSLRLAFKTTLNYPRFMLYVAFLFFKYKLICFRQKFKKTSY